MSARGGLVSIEKATRSNGSCPWIEAGGIRACAKIAAMSGVPLSRVKANYRPQIDGVRAVAVSAVLLFHLGFASIPGGFVGVDVFFVLSGYLISGLLLTEASLKGAVSLGRFYARRARRLLPAAWLVVGFTVVVARLTASPIEYENLRRHAVSAVLYVANWDWVTVDRGYFATDTAPSPLIHYWSLAVEEQFYFAWPALVVLCLWASRRLGISLLRTLTVTFAAITAASIALAVTLTPSVSAYYGTHTRAFELAAGGLLAIVMEYRRTDTAGRGAVARQPSGVLPAVLTVAGLAGIGYLCVSVTGSTSYPGWAAVAVTALSLLLIAGVDLTHDSWAAAVMGNPLFAWVGRLSYSIYLWHWPLVVFWKDDLGRVELTALILAASAVSYYLVEQPLRLKVLPSAAPWRVVASGFAVSALLGFLVIPASLQNSETEEQVLAARHDIAEPPADCPYSAEEWPSPAQSRPCTVYDGSGPTVLLVGDSHAQMWSPALEVLAKDNDWRLLSLTRARCTPNDFTVRRVRDTAGEETVGKACTEWRHVVYPHAVEMVDPDYVIIGSRSQIYDIEKGDRVVRKEDPAYRRLWKQSWAQPIRVFGSRGARVLILQPMPTVPRSMLDCVSTAADAHCEFDASLDKETVRASRFVEQLPKRYPNVQVLDVAELTCPRQRCRGRMDGDIVRQDGSHVTATFAARRASDIGLMLAAAGLAVQR